MKKSSSQTSQIFACSCEICTITAAVCHTTRCVSSRLSTFVTIVIWQLNRHFMFNYAPAEIFLWWGYHFQYFGWHFVWPSLFFLSEVQYFHNDVLSNLFHHLLISVWMPVAIFVGRNRVWKPAFKTQLKHCDFYQLTLVSMEIFSNYLTRKIIFTDIQSRAKLNLLKYFMSASVFSVRGIICWSLVPRLDNFW